MPAGLWVAVPRVRHRCGPTARCSGGDCRHPSICQFPSNYARNPARQLGCCIINASRHGRQTSIAAYAVRHSLQPHLSSGERSVAAELRLRRIISTLKLLDRCWGALSCELRGLCFERIDAGGLCVRARDLHSRRRQGSRNFVHPGMDGRARGLHRQCVDVLGYLFPEGRGSLWRKGLHSSHALGRAYL